MTAIDGILGALLGVPALPGAKCRGRQRLFDPAHPGETPDSTEQRHSAALLLCQGCPALEPCRDYFEGLRPAQRPEGVIAGQVNVYKPRRTAAGPNHQPETND